jgi:hypothetical protein
MLAVYAVFVSTSWGRALDFDIVSRDLEGVPDRLAERLTELISAPTVAVFVVALVVIAYRRGRTEDGVRAAAVVIASGGLARLLETVLGNLDLFGGETAREFGPEFFPSGHAAVIMALPLAILFLTPARSRSRVVLWGGIWSGVVGSLTFAEGASHYPSDVLGAFLLSLAVACAGTWGRRAPAEPDAPEVRLPTSRIAAVLAAVAAVGLLLLAPARLLPLALGPLEPVLLIAGAVVSAAAFVIVLSFARLLQREGAHS